MATKKGDDSEAGKTPEPKRKKELSRSLHLQEPNPDMPDDVPREFARLEFGRRLQKAMNEKGWNQSQLAERASLFMEGKKLSRDLISKYIAGATGPGAPSLNAMCRALGKKPTDMMPTRGVTAKMDVTTAFEMRTMSDGLVWVRINQMVPAEMALRIHQIIGELNPVGRPGDK